MTTVDNRDTGEMIRYLEARVESLKRHLVKLEGDLRDANRKLELADEQIIVRDEIIATLRGAQ